MAKKSVGTWEGGWIHEDKNGRRTFHIKRRVNGNRYEVSTRCHTLKAALAQLQRFEADPENYDPAGPPKREVLCMTEELVREHLEWCRDEKQNSPRWLVNKKSCLAWWTEKLGGKDLRKVTLSDDIDPALEGESSRKNKIAVLKFFYAWLRKKKRKVALNEDPTFGMLTVPQSKPEQWKRSKVIPRENYEKAREHMIGHYRAALDVQAGTGWHVSEVVRFAAGGALEDYVGDGEGIGGVLVCPRTKAGDLLRTAVSPEVFAAGKVLRERGHLSERGYVDAIEAACNAAGVEVIKPGSFRHSVASWAVNAGAPLAQVSAFLGHRSEQTTRRFYATHAVPAKIPTLR